MKKFILIKRINLQDANAIAGFTWGFPAITHFLGFVHALQRHLNTITAFKDVSFDGCVVIAHEHHVKTYRDGSVLRFTQSRNSPYLASHSKIDTPPVIEEGKMNMVVSLLIEVEENLNNTDMLCKWLHKRACMQRLAGGTILSVEKVSNYNFDNDSSKILNHLKRELLPGFVLLNRCDLLAEHFNNLGENYELFDAWKDFIALKRKARPCHETIEKYLKGLAKNNHDYKQLKEMWQKHLGQPYSPQNIPRDLVDYFNQLESTKETKKILKQWDEYCNPTEKTPADWEYQSKPSNGYLVPIMCGYKAISSVQENEKVANTRDNKTDVCFVEAAHSVGEWRSVHRWHDWQAVLDSIWYYHYTEHWYLCCHRHQMSMDSKTFLEPVDTKQDISGW